MKNFKEQKAIIFLLIFPVLEGLLVIVTLLTIQADPKNIFILGYSKHRLVLIGFSIFLSVCFILIFINSTLRKKFIDWLYLSSQQLKWMKLYVVLIFILIIFTLWIPADRFGINADRFVSIRPLFIWFELICVQLIIAMQYFSGEMVFIKRIKEQVPYVILKVKEMLGINFFIPKVLIPLGLLAIYGSSFAYFSFRFLPEGVNYIFAINIFYLTLLVTVVLSLIFLLTCLFGINDKLSINRSAEKFTSRNLLLIFLPITPVVQYVLNNQDILSLIDSLSILVIFTFIAFLYIVVFPYIFRIISSTDILMILGLAFVFTITSMALLSQQYAWFEKGSFGIQLLFFSLVFLVIWLLFNLKDKRVLNVLIVLIFVSNSTTQMLSQDAGTKDPSNPIVVNSLRSLVGERIPDAKPNIYLLVYDAYVANETMLAYGIDNSYQEQYLIDQGFKLYPHTYSVGAASIETMSRVLNASTDFYGDSRRAVSGDGIVQNLFKNLDYRTYGVFPYDYFFLGVGTSYDYSFPEKITAIKQVVTATLIGEFRFDLGFNDQPREQFTINKQNIFGGVSSDPIFMYTHSNQPEHSQNSGSCLPDEIERFQGRLNVANLEMRQDLESIVRSDPEAIIIVAGDHGPYLTKNCKSTAGKYDVSEITRLDIQDRFGTFLAIRWPTEDFSNYDDITILQDLFPSIFAYLYRDASILDSKIDSNILVNAPISRATVIDGIIYGGINDNEPLFLSNK